MALGSTTSSVVFQGDGTTCEYPVSFPFLDTAHIVVGRIAEGGAETALCPGEDYELVVHRYEDGMAHSASVNLFAPLADGCRLAIRRIVPLLQESRFTNQGPNSPKAMEDALDRLTMIAQQLEQEIGETNKRIDDREAGAPNDRLLPSGGEAGDLLANGGEKGGSWVSPVAATENFARAGVERFGVVKADGRSLLADGGVLTVAGWGGGNVVVADARQVVDVSNGETQQAINTGFRGRMDELHALLDNHAERHSLSGSDPLVPLAIGAMPAAPADGSEYLASGNQWLELGRVRRRLLADRTYHVRQDGNDANDGLTAATAFRTLKRVWDELSSLDGGGCAATVSIGPGTWEETTHNNCVFELSAGNTIGFSAISLIGSGLGETTLRHPSAAGAGVSVVRTPAEVTLQHFRIENAKVSVAVTGSTVLFGYLDFAAVPASGWHIQCQFKGVVQPLWPYTISGGGAHHIWLVNGSLMNTANQLAITICNAPAFSRSFLYLSALSSAVWYRGTFSGEVTGRKFQILNMSLFYSGGMGVGYLPGDQAGTLETASGCYYS